MLTKEQIASLSNDTLILVNLEIEKQEQARTVASQNLKFDKIRNKKGMDFPPPNPDFLEYKAAIKAEMSKRKLDTWQ